MTIEIIPQDHQLVLQEAAPELAVGDQVEFVLTDWHEGEIRVSGEVVRLFDHGRVKVRVANGSFSVPAAALHLIDARAA